MISVKHISKVYHLYNNTNDRLKEALSRKQYHKDFYALSDVNFNIKKGEVVGIIGKNGSGKSTLLKIITSVLTPTKGSVAVKGKVTALLELGAGFNPELSGIENIYLSGALASFSKEQMEQKIDSIIEFADIGEHINQPLKTYSSGMKARLGFSVAINIEPEVFIVDEALSVGDSAFARKCYAKIEDICKSDNVTVLFVSHSESTIKQLCSRAILLHQGSVIVDGNAKDVVNTYNKLINTDKVDTKSIKNEFKKLTNTPNKSEKNSKILKKNNSFFNKNYKTKSKIEYPQKGAKIYDIKLTTLEGDNVNHIEQNEYYIYSYKVQFFEDFNTARVAIQIINKIGTQITGQSTYLVKKEILKVEASSIYEISWKFKNILNEGEYLLNCAVNDTTYGEKIVLHRVLDAYLFKVIKKENNDALCLVDFGFDLSVKKEIG